MTNPLLQAQDIVKNYQSPQEYKKIEILKNLSFEINEQEFVSIVGKSGSGKSTLLNVLAGLDCVDSGKIFFQGKNLWSLSDEYISRIRNLEFGFIFQSHYLLPEFDALENVLIPAWIQGKSFGREVQAKELLNKVGLSHRLHHKPSALSGGEAQRVAIARSLMNSPKIIFADEPTGNLDRENADNTIQILLQLVQEHKSSLILVSHDQKIANLASRRYTLENGQLH